MAAPDVALVGRDAADVIGILRDKVGVQVVQRRPHLARVFLIDAEDDRLGEAVGLLQELGQVPGDRLGAGAQRDDPLEILGLVFVVGDRAAVAVEFVLARPPAGRIPFGDDAMHAVRREEAVVDALPQAVFVDRIAEIAVGVAVVLAQRRGRHAELVGRLEVFEDLAPGAVIARAAAMALVDDDQVEEIGRDMLEKAGAALVLGERLIDGEIHLPALDDLAAFDLVARVAEGGEDPVLGVVDENVAVGEVEDLAGAGTRPCGSSGPTRASSRSEKRRPSCRCRSPS